MRLAQVARKLSITTEDIVDFLEIRGITIEKDSNTKLGEDALKLLYKHFEIEENEEIVQESITESNSEEIIPDKEGDEAHEKENQDLLDEQQAEQEDEAKLEKVEVEEESPSEIKEEKKKSFKTVGELLEQQEDDADSELVIKAPKMELKGLNVVGKIDLPEPKPKAEPEPKEEAKEKPKKTYGKPRHQRTGRRNKKSELSPAQIRKRQEQKEARKRERIEKEKKKKREQFYKEKVLKPKQIEQKNKPKKKKKEVEEVDRIKKPKPKTLLGKFWRWLNT
ncbi:hypothetical protein [Marivirga sp.]|uniref:hypothetical protein n=1 Tax=Marivirga sp. TaxID=2018662 RepID=UPI003DA70104